MKYTDVVRERLNYAPYRLRIEVGRRPAHHFQQLPRSPDVLGYWGQPLSPAALQKS